MRKLTGPAIGLSAVLAFGGCTSAASSPEAPSASLSHSAEIIPPLIVEQLFTPNVTDTEYFETNASINLIYLQPTKQAIDHYPDPATIKVRHDLLTANPVLLRLVRTSFAKATHNRYVPSAVTITNGGKITLNNCLTTSAEEFEMIQKAVKPYEKPGTFTVAIVDQPSCATKGKSGAAGFSDSNLVPVVDTDGFSNLALDIVHEAGHSGGLEHAGVATCKAVVRISGCVADPTADKLSVMGYSFQSSVYSNTELGMLGLLKDDEVMRLTETGEYSLHDIGQTGLKVLELPSDAGNPLYLTWEADPQAVADETCIPQTKHTNLNAPNIVSLASTDIGGKQVDYVCYRVHVRYLNHSLQLRTRKYSSGSDAQESLAVVARSLRAINPIDSVDDVGEVTAGTLVYEDSSYTVTLKSVSNGSAVVVVTKTGQ